MLLIVICIFLPKYIAFYTTQNGYTVTHTISAGSLVTSKDIKPIKVLKNIPIIQKKKDIINKYANRTLFKNVYLIKADIINIKQNNIKTQLYITTNEIDDAYPGEQLLAFNQDSFNNNTIDIMVIQKNNIKINNQNTLRLLISTENDNNGILISSWNKQNKLGLLIKNNH